jgi:prenylcysteine oxidase/farnesylcysteine lyase
VKTTSPKGDSSKEYDDVIIATPFHSSGISLNSASVWPLSSSSDSERILPIPPQPYVHLHVTLLTTTSPHPLPAYFGLAPGSTVPQAILTTNENARAGGKAPEFNSLTYHGKISSNRDEYVVKIFSMQKIDDDWLKNVFGEVGWVYRKEVR